MNLDYILELMTKAQARLENGQINYTATAIDEAIQELEKVIAENDKMKCMGASAPAKEEPQDEIVSIKPLVFKDSQEKAFWEKAYLAVFNSNFGNPPQNIADMAVCELRKRLGEREED